MAGSVNGALPREGREGRWQSRPVLSALLRIVIFGVPVAAALGSTWVLRAVMPTPTTTPGWATWWVVLLGTALIVSLGTERVARRLIPLAMLLKLSMLFPDQAPSRFRVARHSGSVEQLRSELAAPGSTDEANDRAGKILGLVTALATHDRKTRGHAERVRVFTDLLSEQLKLPEEDRYRLRWAALLHDIGKLSVEPETLNKPSKLDAAEWEEIRTHPNEGARLAGPLLEWLGPWGDAIVHHHERFDGQGYPAHLAGEEISEAGRIVAVADSYDTMTSARTYQRPRSTAAARRELVACAGGQFDPVVVRAFLEISLPRLLWAVGPVSLFVHLPFLARLQAISQASVASAAQTAAVSALAGVTAVGLLGGPSASVAASSLRRSHPSSRPTTSQTLVFPQGGEPHGPSQAPAHAAAPTHHVTTPGQDHGSGGAGGATSTGSSAGTTTGGSGGGTTTGGSGGGTTGGNTGGSGSGAGGGQDNSSGSGGDGDGGGGGGGGGDTTGGGTGTDYATAAAQIAALRLAILNSGIDGQRIQDLAQRLDDATWKMAEGKLPDACDRVDDFIERVGEASTEHGHGHGHGHKDVPLDPSIAANWIALAEDIQVTLAC